MNKISKLKKLIKTDLVIINNDDLNPNPNFLYYTNNTNINGALIVFKKSNPILITNTRDEEKSSNAKIKLNTLKKGETLTSAIKELIKKINHPKIGLDYDYLTLNLYERIKKSIKAEYENVSEICKIQRSIKEDNEISYLRKACKVTSNAFNKLVKNFKFKTESEVKNFLENEIKKSGCKLSFSTIVASGKNSSDPHYEKSKKLSKGFIVIDFGAKYKGYHADMTRTIYYGNPSNEELKTYNLVLKVQEKLIEEVKINMECEELYNKAIELFGKESKNFIHSLGHGVGLYIHELPNIGPESSDLFKEGMVFTIEPGLYYENKYGIRIEDTLVLNKGKVERLTKTDKKLVIV